MTTWRHLGEQTLLLRGVIVRPALPPSLSLNALPSPFLWMNLRELLWCTKYFLLMLNEYEYGTWHTAHGTQGIKQDNHKSRRKFLKKGPLCRYNHLVGSVSLSSCFPAHSAAELIQSKMTWPALVTSHYHSAQLAFYPGKRTHGTDQQRANGNLWKYKAALGTRVFEKHSNTSPDFIMTTFPSRVLSCLTL